MSTQRWHSSRSAPLSMNPFVSSRSKTLLNHTATRLADITVNQKKKAGLDCSHFYCPFFLLSDPVLYIVCGEEYMSYKMWKRICFEWAFCDWPGFSVSAPHSQQDKHQDWSQIGVYLPDRQTDVRLEEEQERKGRWGWTGKGDLFRRAYDSGKLTDVLLISLFFRLDPILCKYSLKSCISSRIHVTVPQFNNFLTREFKTQLFDLCFGPGWFWVLLVFHIRCLHALWGLLRGWVLLHFKLRCVLTHIHLIKMRGRHQRSGEVLN